MLWNSFEKKVEYMQQEHCNAAYGDITTSVLKFELQIKEGFLSRPSTLAMLSYQILSKFEIA